MNLNELSFTGFDIETSGKYPLESEICEIAAVKYKNGQLVDTFSTLVKPVHLMSAEVIGIHGITNEMVENSPRIHEVIADFRKFVEDTYLIAHHAPFDMGFLTVEMEKLNIPLPTLPVICSSRLSRKLIHDSPNHRLQTLIPHLGIKQGAAHRATDDARACLEVAMICIEKAKYTTLEQVFSAQDGALYWKDYSLDELKFKTKDLGLLIEGIQSRLQLKMTYKSNSGPLRPRLIEPIGLVRNPDGDYLIAYDENPQPKRFYLSKIISVEKP